VAPEQGTSAQAAGALVAQRVAVKVHDQLLAMQKAGQMPGGERRLLAVCTCAYHQLVLMWSAQSFYFHVVQETHVICSSSTGRLI